MQRGQEMDADAVLLYDGKLMQSRLLSERALSNVSQTNHSDEMIARPTLRWLGGWYPPTT